ncbi:hypothetical protein NLJ89_g1263 [Agrocybe chaxingu]|uniref:Translation initiation factor eIF2B subunit delta n=1 Tax=Agrocybe chaxingu TaxID=84603 RepID=A0A9W8TFI0_9AGAR|nr:hypothetical protein NLJ89_g1263 [Agrocybe chaxingu]
MPVPTMVDPEPSVGNSVPSQQTAKKVMTKAERRELQEKQRAAKSALKQSQSQPGKPNQPQQPKQQQQQQQGGGQAKPKPPQTPQKKTFLAESTAAKQDRAAKEAAAEEAAAVQSHGLRIFSHFGQPKPIGHTVKGDIHPTIIRLGLLFSEFKICGANARCIATLTAFKQVIQDYTTPAQNTLSRHLMTHISPQITHLVSARPMSVSMGNAIRELKLEISAIDIDMVEQDAKDALCTKIDNYIRDRIIIADEVIQELAGKKIKDGDVVLTYAKSSVVQKVLLQAQGDGKKFSVIVVDSKPLLEGSPQIFTLHLAASSVTLQPN